MHGQGPQSNSLQRFPPLLGSTPKAQFLDPSDLLWVTQGVRYFRFPGLSANPHLLHGVFTRLGGESEPPFNSLNTSYSVGDLPKRVTDNLQKIEHIMGAEHMTFMNQCHGAQSVILDKNPTRGSADTPSADALITKRPRLAIMVKQADCQGVILYDPEQRVLANVHCGWRGNVQNIPGKVIARMQGVFGCNPEDILAAIGPSLGPCCSQFIGYRKIFPASFQRFMVRENYFDLRAISTWQLICAGIKEENIELSAICTRCTTDLFYSYRGEGNTGRFATVAMLL